MRRQLISLALSAALAACGGASEEATTTPATDATAEVPEVIAPAPKVVQLTFGQKQFFRGNQDVAPYLAAGFGRPEEGGTWTTDKQATLNLPLAPEARGRPISLVISAFGYVSPPKLPSQEVVVSAGGKELGKIKYTKPQDRRDLKIELPADLTAGESLVLTFDIPKAASPLSLDNGADQRVLGMFLNSVELVDPAAVPPTPVTAPAAAPKPTATPTPSGQ